MLAEGEPRGDCCRQNCPPIFSERSAPSVSFGVGSFGDRAILPTCPILARFNVTLTRSGMFPVLRPGQMLASSASCRVKNCNLGERIEPPGSLPDPEADTVYFVRTFHTHLFLLQFDRSQLRVRHVRHGAAILHSAFPRQSRALAHHRPRSGRRPGESGHRTRPDLDKITHCCLQKAQQRTRHDGHLRTVGDQGDDDEIFNGVDLEVDPKAALRTRLGLRPAVAELRAPIVGESASWPFRGMPTRRLQLQRQTPTEPSSEHDMAVPIVPGGRFHPRAGVYPQKGRPPRKTLMTVAPVTSGRRPSLKRCRVDCGSAYWRQGRAGRCAGRRQRGVLAHCIR